MRLLSFLVMMAFNPLVIAADFQVADYVLGTEKTNLKAELPAKTTVTLFEADAKVETQWTDDKLTSVQLSFYQGDNYGILKQKTSQLLTQLNSQFGAVVWVSPEADTAATQTTEQQLGLLEQVMKSAPETAAGYKTSHLANTQLMLDFQPEPQPDNSRLHLQISFSSINGEYMLVLFVDEKAAVARTAAAIINLESF